MATKELVSKATDLLLKREPIGLILEKDKDSDIRRKITVFPTKNTAEYIWYIERWDFEVNDIVADYKALVNSDIFSLVDSLFKLFPIVSVKALF